MRELSERYQVDQEGKLDVEMVRIREEYWLLDTETKIDLLNALQNWINNQRDELQ
jgi:hypothetical protein